MPICAFCRNTFDGLTRDHVPSRGLFGDNLPSNLITVPACKKCNNNTSKDDEYFRLLALEFHASDLPSAQQVNDSVLRSFKRPQAKRFRESVYSTLKPIELLSPAGLYVGKSFTMKMEMARLSRTVEKIIRGLFFHTKGYPVPEDYRVWSQCLFNINEAGARVYLEQIVPAIKDTPVEAIGDRVFRYRYGWQLDTPNIVFFQLGFYERIDFFGFTAPKSSEMGFREQCEAVSVESQEWGKIT
jgi:hypothetical protein